MKDIYKLISDIGIIPTLSFKTVEDALPVAKALEENAITVIEVMCRTEQAIGAVREIKGKMPQMTVGAGTVLSVKLAQDAIEAGAQFIVAPGFNRKVVEYCVEQGVPVIPGCTTPTEIESAMELGLKTLKFFPSALPGVLDTLKLYAAAYPEVKFLTTGGLDKTNFTDFLKLSNVCAAGGSFLVDKQARDQRDWQKLSDSIKETLSLQFDFKLAHLGINCQDEGEANSVAHVLADFLNMPAKQTSKSVFAGKVFEVMKTPYFGVNGHVAISTRDVPRAYAYFIRKGYSFIEETAAYDEVGKKLKVIYFRDEISGFAFHLLPE